MRILYIFDEDVVTRNNLKRTIFPREVIDQNGQFPKMIPFWQKNDYLDNYWADNLEITLNWS